MTYHFRIGERVEIAWCAPRHRGTTGVVTEVMNRTGAPDAQGIKTDRLRVRPDGFQNSIICDKRDVNPL